MIGLRTLVTRLAAQRRLSDALILVTLVTVTCGERSWLAAQRNIMEPGDTFNFLSIAQALSQGRVPQGENRLPFYPLTILVGWKLGADPIAAATAVSVLASAGTTAVLYLLGRRLGVHRLPLALFLLLLVISPLPNSIAIRPLADSLFLFLVLLAVYLTTTARPTIRSALTTGIVFVLMSWTRFEGFLFAALLLPLLRFRVPWRLVCLAAVPFILSVVAWFPFTLHVHGSIRGGYFSQFASPDFGDIHAIPAKLRRIAQGTGWLFPWEHAHWVLDQPGNPVRRLAASASWWVGMLAIIGVPWLLLRARSAALPFVGVFLLYSSVYSIWFLYSRFVAPLVSGFFLATAAGASALFSIALSLFRPRALRAVAVGAITVFLLWIVREEAPGLMAATTQRVFDNEGSGYSMVLAIKELARREDRVALVSDLMAGLYLGLVDAPDAPPQRALYIDALTPEAAMHPRPEETGALADRLREKDIRYLIDRDEPHVRALVAFLADEGRIVETEEIRYPKGQPPGLEFDVTRIHTLSWERVSAPDS